jgi:phosphatidate phosphatase PAH1
MTSNLVAYTYLTKPHSEIKLEVDHINNDITNNHYSNLQWLTHKENIAKRIMTKPVGRPAGFKLSEETKHKQSLKKQKKVSATNLSTKEITHYNSIAELCLSLHMHRKTFNRILSGKHKTPRYVFVLDKT